MAFQSLTDFPQHKNQLRFRQIPKRHSFLINLFIQMHTRNWILVKERMRESYLLMPKLYLMKNLMARVRHLKKEIEMKWKVKLLLAEKTVSYRMEKMVRISVHLTGERFVILKLK